MEIKNGLSTHVEGWRPNMGKKNKKKLIEWQEEQKPAPQPTRKEIEKAFSKQKNKRPMIRSSHR